MLLAERGRQIWIALVLQPRRRVLLFTAGLLWLSRAQFIINCSVIHSARSKIWKFGVKTSGVMKVSLGPAAADLFLPLADRRREREKEESGIPHKQQQWWQSVFFAADGVSNFTRWEIKVVSSAAPRRIPLTSLSLSLFWRFSLWPVIAASSFYTSSLRLARKPPQILINCLLQPLKLWKSALILCLQHTYAHSHSVRESGESNLQQNASSSASICNNSGWN